MKLAVEPPAISVVLNVCNLRVAFLGTTTTTADLPTLLSPGFVFVIDDLVASA